MEHKREGDIICDTNCSWFRRNGPRCLGRETSGTGNLRRKKEDIDHKIKISENHTKESSRPEKTTVKKHFLKNGVKNI